MINGKENPNKTKYEIIEKNNECFLYLYKKFI